MSDEIAIGGKQYVSSKRAAELTGYAQDYIGQLARGGDIEAQRVEGLWYVSMDSLNSYKDKADTYVPTQPSQEPYSPESLIALDGKDYVSASRASKITGYNQDYVGQLARSGKILSRRIGNRWYIERDSILAHKKEKDSLLATLQAESVGIVRQDIASSPVTTVPTQASIEEPAMKYTNDARDLLPVLNVAPELEDPEERTVIPIRTAPSDNAPSAPSRVSERQPEAFTPMRHAVVMPVQYQFEPKRRGFSQSLVTSGAAVATVLTIVIVFSFGYPSLKSGATYATNIDHLKGFLNANAMSASASSAIEAIGDLLEQLIVPELHYKRDR